MSYKIAFVCALALVQSISAQCIGAYNGLDILGAPYGPYGIGPYIDGPLAAPYGIAPCAAGLGPAALAASNGGGLAVTSASAIAPTGVSMVSENAYEGALAVTGAVPFLGAVALDGALPTVGAGAVTYTCGNGNVAVLSEDFTAAGFGAYGFDGLVGPAFAYDGLVGPYYNGIGACGIDGIGPYGYNGIIGPYGYDGLVGPYGYDGIVGPAYGPYGYGGLYY